MKIFTGFLVGVFISIVYTFICSGDVPNGSIFLAYLIGAIMGERAYEEFQK